MAKEPEDIIEHEGYELVPDRKRRPSALRAGGRKIAIGPDDYWAHYAITDRGVEPRRSRPEPPQRERQLD